MTSNSQASHGALEDSSQKEPEATPTEPNAPISESKDDNRQKGVKRQAPEPSTEEAEPPSKIAKSTDQETAREGEGKQPTPQSSREAVKRSPLHYEMLAFEALLTPDAIQSAQADEVFEFVKESALSIWPEASVQRFGSRACGLALKSADLDVAIQHTGQVPEKRPGLRKRCDRLRRLKDLLRKDKRMQDNVPILGSKMPTIRTSFRASMDAPAIKVDITIDDGKGLQGVELCKELIANLPPLKPIFLVLKAALKERNLLEVFTGGISSYTLLNMVVAHLQAEGYDRNQSQQPASCETDLGKLLWGFLTRFGEHLNVRELAVSINKRGGFFKKPSQANHKKHACLYVEDPLEDKMDIAGGSVQILKILEIFQIAAKSLNANVIDAMERIANGPVKLEDRGPPLLNTLFTVDAMTPELQAWGGIE